MVGVGGRRAEGCVSLLVAGEDESTGHRDGGLN